MSTFTWRETLKAIKPPLFTRLGCVLLTAVLTMHFFALVTGGLVIYQNFLVQYEDRETQQSLTNLISLSLSAGPIAVILFSVIAFFESVDFLIWLKLPLYPPKPAPPPDPLQAFRPPER